MNEIEVEDFKDFKPNDVCCDNCSKIMGTSSEQIISSFLCESCTNGLEELYKEKHPEEYD